MVTKEGRLAVLKLLTDQDQISDLKIRLAKTIGYGGDADLELADFTECDFDGYAEVSSPTFSAPAINGDDRGDAVTDDLTWTAGAGLAAPQTIVGVYVVIDFVGIGERLYFFKRVSPTVTLANPGEEFVRKVRQLSDNLGV